MEVNTDYLHTVCSFDRQPEVIGWVPSGGTETPTLALDCRDKGRGTQLEISSLRGATATSSWLQNHTGRPPPMATPSRKARSIG